MFRTVTNITLFKGKINDICHKYEKNHADIYYISVSEWSRIYRKTQDAKRGEEDIKKATGEQSGGIESGGGRVLQAVFRLQAARFNYSIEACKVKGYR